MSFFNKQMILINDKEKRSEKYNDFLLKSSHYEKIKDNLEDLDFAIEDIDGIVLKEDEKIIDRENNS